MSLARSMPAPSATPVRPVPRRIASPTTSRPPKLRYIIATLAGIFAILLGQLGLSVALGSGAYELRDLERQLAERNRDLSIVTEEIGHLQDPQTLAQLAVTLGMVSNGDPAYLRLSDATVVGSGKPAQTNSTTLVNVVDSAPQPSAMAAAQALVSQAPPSSQSVTAFDDGTAQGLSQNQAPQSLAGPSSYSAQPAVTVQQQPLGGDLPAPVTR